MWWFIGFVVFIILLIVANKVDLKNGIDHNAFQNNNGQSKKCPYCGSTSWQYAGQEIVGARDPKIKTQHSLNLNPLKPFTLVNSKEKVVRKGSQGIAIDNFICSNCGKRFR